MTGDCLEPTTCYTKPLLPENAFVAYKRPNSRANFSRLC